jgi:hypothetical protein
LPLKQASETCFAIFVLNFAGFFGLKSILDLTLLKARLEKYQNIVLMDFFLLDNVSVIH